MLEPRENIRFHTHLGGGGQVKVDLSYAHCESLQLLPSGLVREKISARPLFNHVLLEALMQCSAYICYNRCRSNHSCPCHIEVLKGIRNLGEKQNQFTGNVFNYWTSLQRFIYRCHCSVEVSERIKNLGVKTKSGHRCELNCCAFLKEFFFRCVPECVAGRL